MGFHSNVQSYPECFCFKGYAVGAYPSNVAVILTIGYLPTLLVMLRPLILWLRGRGLAGGQRNVISMSSRTRELICTFTVCYLWALTWIDLAIIINMPWVEQHLGGEAYTENKWGYGQ